MKKFFSLAIVLIVISSVAGAQSRFGIKGGLNFNTLENVTKAGGFEEAWKSQTGFQVGVLWQIKVPLLGLAIQPELLYSQVRTTTSSQVFLGTPIPIIEVSDIKMDYITLPVNIQLGIDLLLLRPFIFVSPYISYAVGKGGEFFENSQWDDINRFNYGVGAGVGLDIWKLQIVGKYNWDLGKLMSAENNNSWDNLYKNAKLQGFQISVGFLF